ncbi:MAG: hypothetical protein HC896_04915 [Bacteroidales bacterium]|nr:hypothetical protein [Bacteroidales bacterium]
MKRNQDNQVPEVEEVIATGCVIQNIYLAMDVYGLSGYLSTGDICYTPQIKEF